MKGTYSVAEGSELFMGDLVLEVDKSWNEEFFFFWDLDKS